ncbi:hypothetical protein [Alkaliphilus transvaalensis]|uniref:hypothetical protein n=1 Tax=Alkaliphilus transvaalensis TaxID=114628 RepID=UPI00047E6F47|nr:hypothetical protein [Alkaliphilus transvaalensis]
MKKKLLIILFLILTITQVVGCAMQTNTSKRFIEDNIDFIEISDGKMKKVITELEDINRIINLLNEMRFSNISEDIEYNPVYEISIVDDKRNVNFISFVGQRVYYQEQWYDIDISVINEITTYFEGLNYPEEPIEIDLENVNLHRSNMPMDIAIYGSWVTTDDEMLTFDETYLYQGSHKFKYVITEELENGLIISVYGIRGFLIKERKLFNLYLIFDETKNNVQLMKTFYQMGSTDLVYKYNMVLKDENNNLLGKYHSAFFSKDVFDEYNHSK